MSDSEDDYMSDAVLKVAEQVKPGVSKSREHERQLRIHKRGGHIHKPKHELEAERRHEALNKPVESSNKGFALLAKMGYKAGMALGKRKEGEDAQEKLAEPIQIQIKTGRTGIGHAKQEKEEQVERCEAHLKEMAKQAKECDVMALHFRKKKQGDTLVRQIISDIMKSRKASQDLDMRIGLKIPAEPFLWPILRKVAPNEGIPFLKRPKMEVPEEEFVFEYANGESAPPEEDLNDLEEPDLKYRLYLVTRNLRSQHFYCVWCGCAFSNQEDLFENCPGPGRDCHDEDGKDM